MHTARGAAGLGVDRGDHGVQFAAPLARRGGVGILGDGDATTR